ncbi:unnamed protein product [Malus baccata var. baccata]
MDPTLTDSCVRDHFLRCVHVGLLCVEENAGDRPTISNVISMLTNESVALPMPTKPAFFTERNHVAGGKEPEDMSTNCFIMATINLLFLIIFAGLWSSYDGRDTLKQGDTLNSSSSLVSASGNFTLSFVVYILDGSNCSFLAIMRNGESATANRAWIGNRDSPVLYPSSPLLTLDFNNTLKISQKNEDQDPIVICSAPHTSNNNTSVVATLLDSGNLVLQQVNSVDGSMNRVFLWQSFDYPMDTFLPGMKLGVNHRNGHIWSLSSWSGIFNPAPGTFTLDWDPNQRQLKLRRKGVIFWTSGVLKSDGRFGYMLSDESMMKYKFIVVSNENEDYVTYTAAEGGSPQELVLYTTGSLYEYSVQRDVAQVEKCDGYYTEGGCVRKDRPSECTSEFGGEFELRNGSFEPSNVTNTSRDPYWFGSSNTDCKATCWQNCDCLGFDFPISDNHTTGCRFWSVDSQFVENITGSGTTNGSFVLPRKSSTPTKSSSQNFIDSRICIYGETWLINVLHAARKLWIVIAIPTALLVALGCILYQLKRRKFSLSDGNGRKIQNELLNFMSSNRRNDHGRGFQNYGKMGHSELSAFSYPSVLAATCNFSEENKLGQGGFGPVYKVTGYMSPEYAMDGIFSIKSDVFSFGVLMLEMISGRKNNSFYNDEHVLNLVGYVRVRVDKNFSADFRDIWLTWKLWKEGAGIELMDPTLTDSCVQDQFLRCVHVGLLCVEENAGERPTISNVISMLTNESVVLPMPTKPAFFTERNHVAGGKEPEDMSINCLSNSEIFFIVLWSFMATCVMMKKSIFLIIFACLWTCHDARDTLAPGDTLDSSSSLESASAKFTLSFVEQLYSNFTYLAIRHNKYNPNKAWIGNRNRPISSSSSPLLTLDSNYTLKITQTGEDPIVICSAPQTSNSTSSGVVATLLDSGNLVLQEMNGSRVFWQSFDYPGDTFLPGMKLGINHSDGHIWSLVSYVDTYNPALGPFSLVWDPNEHELKINKSGVVYWTSGVLRSDGTFEFILPNVSKKRYNFSIVSNENYGYLTYTAVGDQSLQPEWVLYSSGILQEYEGQMNIVQAQNCDGYDTDGGCVRRFQSTKSSGPKIVLGTAYYLLQRRRSALASAGENRTEIENEMLIFMKSNRPTDDVNGLRNDGKIGHHDLSVFSYSSILAATSNFAEENKLGEGGFGPVYKAWELWKEGAGIELTDPTLGNSFIKEQLLRCIHVGLLCVEENAADRPTMSDVISMLTNESLPLASPTKPAFFVGRRTVEAGISGNQQLEIVASANYMSSSDFEARGYASTGVG